ncbi:MAG: GxxExxY protein [Anaerolineales bacterium]
MVEILFKELSYAIIGAAIEVHRTLGAGFLEAVYQAALAYELTLRNIPFEQRVHLPVYYKGQLVGEYIADFVIDGKIILEIKAVSDITEAHRAQAINYLTATGCELAILLNFGAAKLQQERLVRFKDFEKKA